MRAQRGVRRRGTAGGRSVAEQTSVRTGLAHTTERRSHHLEDRPADGDRRADHSLRLGAERHLLCVRLAV